jgi:hypothetical protein
VVYRGNQSMCDSLSRLNSPGGIAKYVGLGTDGAVVKRNVICGGLREPSRENVRM